MARGVPLALLIIAAIAVRALLFTGLTGEDDHFLISIAHDLDTGKYEFKAHHQYTRLGILIPLAITGRITHWNPDLFPLYGFVCSIGLVILTYAIGRRWFSPQVGYVSGMVMAFFPNDIHFAGAVHVDVPSTFWCVLAIFLLWPGRPGQKDQLLPRSILWRGVAAGLSLGLAYLTKEMILLMLPWLAIWFLRDRISRGRLVWMAVGLAAVVAAESAFYAAAGAEEGALHRAASILGGTTPEAVTGLHTPIERWLWAYPRITIVPNGYLGLLYPLMAAAIIALLAQRAKGWGFLIGWWAVTWAFIAWTPGSLDPPRPALNVTPRYLEMIAVPAALLIGLAVAEARRYRTAWQAALALFMLVGIAGAWKIRFDVQSKITPLRWTLDALRGEKVRTIASDPWSTSQLRILGRFRSDVSLVTFGASPPSSDSETVVVIWAYGLTYASRFWDPTAPSKINTLRNEGTRVRIQEFPAPPSLPDLIRGVPAGSWTMEIYRGPW